MKRFLAAVLIVLICLCCASAASADGKVFPIGHEIYSLFDSLFISSGYVQPATSRPWTAAEARNELARLDVSKLDENRMALYRRLEEMIAEPETDESITVGVELSPEVYIHTNESYAV